MSVREISDKDDVQDVGVAPGEITVGGRGRPVVESVEVMTDAVAIRLGDDCDPARWTNVILSAAVLRRLLAMAAG